MSQFVNINKQFSPNDDFWELNPQIALIPPFSKLKEREDSSKLMWIIFFMSDPDPAVNKLFRIPERERKELLETEYFEDIDWEDEELKECLEAYPSMCLNAVERSLKDMKEFLTRRANILKNIDEAYYIANMSKIDNAISKNDKIYKDYGDIEQKFLKSKDSSRVRGGRRESKSEMGEI